MAQTKQELKIKFSDGKRPSGNDLGELIDSFINTKDDPVKKDENGNIVITLGDIATAAAGTIRFHDNKIQFFDGAAWQNVGSGTEGGFAIVPAAGANPESLSYNNGNVRINVGDTAPTPGTKLEVGLSSNEQAKIGNAAISNGTQAFSSAAQFSRFDKATNDSFALRQTNQGDVLLNAPPNRKITLTYQGTDVRLCVVPPIPSFPPTLPNGAVIINNDRAIENSGGAVFQVDGDIFIRGNATKTTTGEWSHSDVRLKKDIKPFKDGLAKVLQLNPVQFKYNGKAGTSAGQEQIGIIGQEVAEILPYTISKRPSKLSEDESPTDILFYNSNAITYVLINAIQELSAKVDELQNRLHQLDEDTHN